MDQTVASSATKTIEDPSKSKTCSSEVELPETSSQTQGQATSENSTHGESALEDPSSDNVEDTTPLLTSLSSQAKDNNNASQTKDDNAVSKAPPPPSATQTTAPSTEEEQGRALLQPKDENEPVLDREGGTTPLLSSDASKGTIVAEEGPPKKTPVLRLPDGVILPKKRPAKKPLLPLPEEKELSDKGSMSPLLPLHDENNSVYAVAGDGGDSRQQDSSQPQQAKQMLAKRLYQVYRTYEFLILVLFAIVLARAYPPLGGIYLAPKITAGWIYVCIIFVLAGLGLKTEEFAKAFQRIWFNLYVQIFSFGINSILVYMAARLLVHYGVLQQDLADGMVVCACLPTTINMVIVLTKSANGDEPLAIINAAAGNMVGVFLSPVLILGYLGVKGDVDLISVFYKLALRVVLPVAVGQVIQKTMRKVSNYYKSHKKEFRKFQEYCLVFIVYTVFCRTFLGGTTSSIADIFLMIAYVSLLLIGLKILAWVSLGLLFPGRPKMRVCGFFICTQKTISMGIPVINALYEESPSVGLYTLPLLIWHPMQLLIGTFLVPKLESYVRRELIRLRQYDDISSSHGPTDGRPSSQSTPSTPNLETNAESALQEQELPSSSVSTISKLTPKGSQFSRVSQFEAGNSTKPESTEQQVDNAVHE